MVELASLNMVVQASLNMVADRLVHACWNRLHVHGLMTVVGTITIINSVVIQHVVRE